MAAQLTNTTSLWCVHEHLRHVLLDSNQQVNEMDINPAMDGGQDYFVVAFFQGWVVRHLLTKHSMNLLVGVPNDESIAAAVDAAIVQGIDRRKK